MPGSTAGTDARRYFGVRIKIDDEDDGGSGLLYGARAAR